MSKVLNLLRAPPANDFHVVWNVQNKTIGQTLHPQLHKTNKLSIAAKK
jgi:hypothetical protein